MPRKKDPDAVRKIRKDARRVPVKECNHQSLFVMLPNGIYPPANSGAVTRAKRAQINDNIVFEMELFFKNGNSPYVNLEPLNIGSDWVKTHVQLHIPQGVWKQWKNKSIVFSFKNFVQNYLTNNV